MVADEKALKGEQGNFAVLDARPHCISRIELYSTEEAPLDLALVNILCVAALAALIERMVKLNGVG